MNLQKIVYMNAALFACILILGTLLMVPKPEIPVVTKDSVAWLHEQGAAGGVDTTGVDPDSEYPSFGQKNMFETLLPRPTPKPTPVPTPKPDPKLTDATRNWMINGVLRTQVYFTDKTTKQEQSAAVGSTLVVPVGREKIRVIVESTDTRKMSATFRYDGVNDPPQRVTLSAWDERGGQ